MSFSVPRPINVYHCGGFFASILDQAWDHDDAFECSQNQVPIKIRVESYRSYAKVQMPAYDGNSHRHSMLASVLRHERERYFDEHAGLSFENENQVRLLRRAEAMIDLEPKSDKDSLVEKWDALYGFETTRWLLLAMTVALDSNCSSVQALPESFEILRQSPNCYIT
jgi:hypothetical protein